jgi:hypothetical protein
MNSPLAAYYRRGVSENTGFVALFSLSRHRFRAILGHSRQVHNTL